MQDTSRLGAVRGTDTRAPVACVGDDAGLKADGFTGTCAAAAGYCQHGQYGPIARRHCQRTCGLCGPVPSGAPVACVDLLQYFFGGPVAILIGHDYPEPNLMDHKLYVPGQAMTDAFHSANPRIVVGSLGQAAFWQLEDLLKNDTRVNLTIAVGKIKARDMKVG